MTRSPAGGRRPRAMPRARAAGAGRVYRVFENRGRPGYKSGPYSRYDATYRAYEISRTLRR
jgi:hypothetical protein